MATSNDEKDGATALDERGGATRFDEKGGEYGWMKGEGPLDLRKRVGNMAG